MLGNDVGSTSARTTVRLKAPPSGSVEIGFEPIGSTFSLSDDDFLTLELDVADVSGLEFVSWPNGIAVWVPFPGDYIVRDSSGAEIDRL